MRETKKKNQREIRELFDDYSFTSVRVNLLIFNFIKLYLKNSVLFKFIFI